MIPAILETFKTFFLIFGTLLALEVAGLLLWDLVLRFNRRRADRRVRP